MRSRWASKPCSRGHSSVFGDIIPRGANHARVGLSVRKHTRHCCTAEHRIAQGRPQPQRPERNRASQTALPVSRLGPGWNKHPARASRSHSRRAGPQARRAQDSARHFRHERDDDHAHAHDGLRLRRIRQSPGDVPERGGGSSSSRPAPDNGRSDGSSLRGGAEWKRWWDSQRREGRRRG
jgi:hypothetical protein